MASEAGGRSLTATLPRSELDDRGYPLTRSPRAWTRYQSGPAWIAKSFRHKSHASMGKFKHADFRSGLAGKIDWGTPSCGIFSYGINAPIDSISKGLGFEVVHHGRCCWSCMAMLLTGKVRMQRSLCPGPGQAPAHDIESLDWRVEEIGELARTNFLIHVAQATGLLTVDLHLAGTGLWRTLAGDTHRRGRPSRCPACGTRPMLFIEGWWTCEECPCMVNATTGTTLVPVTEADLYCEPPPEYVPEEDVELPPIKITLRTEEEVRT